MVTTTTPRPTSLWLVPAEPHRAELRAHIDALARQHGAPAFEPHVTLASGDIDPHDALAAIERVAGDWAPFDVVAGPTAHGTDRFKAVFVELHDARIHVLAGELCAALDLPFDPAQLQPHLSLLYVADLPPRVRETIAGRHHWTGRTVRFDTLLASVPAGDQDDVARWQSPVVRRLTGPSPRSPGAV
jgi:hypothetical protein